MGVTNLYPNLPGHLVEFKDGGLQLTTNPENASGKSLLILGTAFDGPINEPVQIDATTVGQLFGSEVNEKGYPNGATLTKYAKQAFKNGFTDVRCMRVTGAQAYTEIAKPVSETTEIIDAAPVTGTIEGNAAVTLQLTKTPIIGDSLKVTTGPNASGATVPTSGYTENDGTFSIAEGATSKNSPIYATYQYKVINTIAEEDVISAGNVANLASITSVLYDENAGEHIYVNEHNDARFPDTKGFKATIQDGAVVLEEGRDYIINGASLKWLEGGNLKDGDEIVTEYYLYTIAEATDSFNLQDEEQVVTLNNEPVANSVVLTVGGSAVEADKFVVSGKDVTLTAGNFAVNDTFSISYKYESKNTITEGIIVRAIYGGSVYKDASISITEITNDNGEKGRKFTFTKPEAKKYSNSDLPFSFTSFDFPTVGALKQALASYELNNVFEIVCEDDDELTGDIPAFIGKLDKISDNAVLDGVVVTNNQMFEALSGKRYTQADVDNGDCTVDMIGYLKEQGAYQILENYNVDYIYPAGIYADSKQTINPNSNFHYELAILCAVLTYRTKMTHGFIDVKPNSNTTLVGIQKYVDKLLALDNIHYMKDDKGNEIADQDGKKMDLGWYTSIVVGPEPVMVSDTLGTYYGSPSIAYAALNGIIKPQSAPTNKALPGVKGMKYKFSNKQMNELVGNRMVVFKLKNEGTATASSTPYVVDGCTAGAPGSDYARLATVKVITDVVDQIREVSDPFLGEPNTVEQRNALAALISKRLSYLLQQGEILHYEFEINATVQQVVLGECSISLTLVAPQELRKITTVVALRATA